MSMRGLNSLSSLAKILEEASNPESTVREDRQRPKVTLKKTGSGITKRVIDPKRKAWHDRRLKALAKNADVENKDESSASVIPVPVLASATKAVASTLGGSLLQTLAAAKEAKPKTEGKSKTEAWRRKPGESLF
jgi:hypothetical protein